MEDPLDVRLEDGLEVVVLEHGEEIVADHARVVHEHVDASGPFDEGLDAGVDRGAVASVDLHRGDLETGIFRHDRVGRGLVAEVGEGHVHARPGEALDDGPADAAAAAGDEGEAAGEAVRDLECGRAHPEMA